MTGGIAPGQGNEVLGDRYRLLDQIGTGGMSVVWRAHDEVLDRQVAVKLLAATGDHRFRSRLQAEARASSRLNAPGIAQIYDYGEARSAAGDTVPYLVMEFVDGQPLSRQLVACASLPWRTAADFGSQIADALGTAHAAGLVHRDIKPDNVVITTSGVKLIDFGISAIVGSSDAEEDGRLLGTAAYLAPERIIDAPVSAAADVYALGVLLYRMVSGHLPWPADTNTGLLEAHLYLDPVLNQMPDDAPAEFARLCATCMDKDPYARPSVAEMARVLRRVADMPAPASIAVSVPAVPIAVPIADGAVPHSPTRSFTTAFDGMPPLEDVDRRSRRPGRWQLALAACVVALVALAAVLWATSSSTSSATTATTVTTNATCHAAFAVTRDWGSGFTANLAVTNDAAVPVSGWRVAFAFPGDQSIDATTGSEATVTPSVGTPYRVAVDQSGATVVAGAVDRNHALSPHESVLVPIAANYTHANPIPTVVRLNGTACRTSVAGAATQPTPTPTTSTGSGDGHGDGHGDGGGGGHGKGGGHGDGGGGGGGGGGNSGKD